MKNIFKVFGIIIVSMIIGITILACPGEPTGNDPADKTALSAKITEANGAKTGVRTDTAASNVPLGISWVTASEMSAFESAIAAAVSVRDNESAVQAAVDAATEALTTAINTFNTAKKAGTAAALNVSALASKITEATILMNSVTVAENGSQVAIGSFYVTAAVKTALQNAINAAQVVHDTATVQAVVDTAVTTLNTAMTTFTNARQGGTQTEGFTQAQLTQLIANANTAKTGVTSSTNGNDVGPEDVWVTLASLDTLNAAITAAGSANDSNRDTLYLALSNALVSFNNGKHSGNVPNKESLQDAIISANTAKDGVLTAASASDATLNSKWATTAQWAPFNTAYDSAVAALNNGNATVNAVNAAISALTSATAAFSSAVTGNGPGTHNETPPDVNTEVLVASYGAGAYNVYTKNFTGSKSFDIVNLPGQSRDNVMKISNPTQWYIASLPLLNAQGINITVTFSADVKRVGSAGDLRWQLTTPNYPTVASVNAAEGQWYQMSGTWTGTPADNGKFFYLNADNSANAIFYIDNLVITVTGNGYVPPTFPEPNPDLTLPSLKTAYSAFFPIGNIIDSIYMGEPYFSLLKHHYSIVTPGNNLKPQYLAPTARGGAYQWAEADAMVNKVISNGMDVFGHALVWHRQTPDWMTTGTQAEVQTNLTSYITTVLNHFSGRINAWDVANEIFRDGLSGVTAATDWKTCLRTDAPWYMALGANYIELAYRTARAAAPGVTLYYNDYSMDDQNKARAVANMIRDLNQKYRDEGNSRNLIEGMGMQSHYQIAGFSVSNVQASLDMFIGLGIEVAISELDLRIGTYSEGARLDTPMSSADATAQADLYAELFDLYKSRASSISRVSMWGMDDYNSWLSVGNPCLFDRNLNAKPAFHAIKSPGSPAAETVVGSYNAYASNPHTQLSSAQNYQIVNLPQESRTGVIKIVNPAESQVAHYDLAAYKNQEISITFSAEIKRVGAAGNLNWQVNNSNYPSVGSSINNAATGTWHSMSGTWTGTPTSEYPAFYLSTYQNNSDQTTYYIDNFTITITPVGEVSDDAMTWQQLISGGYIGSTGGSLNVVSGNLIHSGREQNWDGIDINVAQLRTTFGAGDITFVLTFNPTLSYTADVSNYGAMLAGSAVESWNPGAGVSLTLPAGDNGGAGGDFSVTSGVRILVNRVTGDVHPSVTVVDIKVNGESIILK